MIIPGYESALLLAKDPVINGEYYRILTVALLHGGLLHLGFNLYSLHLLGTPVEAFFGKGRYLTIFIGSLIAASFASLTFNPPYVYSIGASGAIFGLFGALAVGGKRMGVDFRSIGTIVAINFALGFIMSGIDWHAHLGGLLGGAAVTWVLQRTRER
ncbi:MAG: rhomboid family intramembrane serine protease [Actinobacteria bacterium]|nr:rhomboid family intramembrane serine protease [Actinomycetota bacterium]MSW16417.1 rhomboid family intramembrane serine protease [Actinomycetota bacterium]MSX44361.1 rhomboid family intramembrane serine protease [Actinomycetota bacterium]MSZ61662.1 rhomboid family intramembrane serine protease [Actinomycetota bacterium]